MSLARYLQIWLLVIAGAGTAFVPYAQESGRTKRTGCQFSVTRSDHMADLESRCQRRRSFIVAPAVFALSWFQSRQPSSASLVSDEISFEFAIQDLQQGLGLELADVVFQNSRRVVVKFVAPDSIASKAGIQANWIFVAVNDQSMERTNALGVTQYLRRTIENNSDQGSIRFIFRDPTLFQSKLNNLASETGPVTTLVAPAGDITQPRADGGVVTSTKEQRVTVEQLEAPKMCHRGASVDDLLEISYTGSVLETGDLFDGSSISINGKELPGRGSDTTLYFVLGKQPSGQFPPSWDVGLTGMCVGERRRLTIPPVLAYGSKGLPRRRIPPSATLQYDVSLISINGFATPQ
jgi:FK506-binding protein 2